MNGWRNKIWTVVFSLLILIAVFMLFVVFVVSDRQDVVVTGANSVAAESTIEPASMEAYPRNWQSYTNEAIDYTIGYPASWGVLSQTEVDSGGYRYTFESRPEITLTQGAKEQALSEPNGDYTAFNSFSVDADLVTLCSNTECLNKQTFPIDEVRLFNNMNKHEGMEIFIAEEGMLSLFALVETGKAEYPGLNVFVQVDDDSDPDEDLQEATRVAHSAQYDFFGELREFIELIR